MFIPAGELPSKPPVPPLPELPVGWFCAVAVLPTDDAWLAALKGDLPACWPLCAAGEGTLRGAGEVKFGRCGIEGGVAVECAFRGGCFAPCAPDGVGVAIVYGRRSRS